MKYNFYFLAHEYFRITPEAKHCSYVIVGSHQDVCAWYQNGKIPGHIRRIIDHILSLSGSLLNQVIILLPGSDAGERIGIEGFLEIPNT